MFSFASAGMLHTKAHEQCQSSAIEDNKTAKPTVESKSTDESVSKSTDEIALEKSTKYGFVFNAKNKPLCSPLLSSDRSI